IAASKMKHGYIMEIVDLDTKAQAIEAGAHPRDQKALDGKMEELAKGLQEKVLTLRAPEDLYDIEGLTRASRFVIARIWTRNDKGEKDQLGYVVSAERLHNIKTKKGFTYGGKDDPVLLAFAQGDWPAPGEITSPWAACPMVAGDCRGSHNLHIIPMPRTSGGARAAPPEFPPPLDGTPVSSHVASKTHAGCAGKAGARTRNHAFTTVISPSVRGIFAVRSVKV